MQGYVEVIIMGIYDIEKIVVYEMYCSLPVFWENVEDAGWTRPRVLSVVRKCKTSKALRKFISKFI